jgi:DNA-binding NarL/FixJ family response regulator
MNMLNEQPASYERFKDVSILVVDDSPTILHAICALLEIEKGIEIVGRAADGQEAIEAVAGLHPEVVLMDVSMPRMNGLAATKLIVRHFPSTKVFLMSSEDSPYLREECVAFGAVAFIYKPRFRKELLAAVQENGQPVKIDIEDTDVREGRPVSTRSSSVEVASAG